MIPDIDIIRCLRSRKAYKFVAQSNIQIIGEKGLPVLVQTIDRAWSQAPDGINFLLAPMITPYLPSELQPDTLAHVDVLLQVTNEFYETSKALQIAYALVAMRRLSTAVNQTFQENATSIEIGVKLRKAFGEFVDLDVQLKRVGEIVDDNNRLIIEPGFETTNLVPPGNKSRVRAMAGGDLDIALGGGFEEGTYTILLGSKGEGKTWTSSCFAAHNARMGKNVLLFTLENSKYSIAQRTYPLYLGFPYIVASYRNFIQTLVRTKAPLITEGVIRQLLETFLLTTGDLLLKQWLEDYIKRISKLSFPMNMMEAIERLQTPFHESLNLLRSFREKQLKGTIDIRFYPANSLKISNIEKEIESSDRQYDLMIIDYLNAVSVPGQTARHEYLGWFANEIRRLSSETHCASIINAQLKRGFKMFSKAVNKGGLDEEVFYEFVAESFSAVWGADYVMVLLSTPTVHKSGTSGGHMLYDRSLLLNRAREVVCGDWFAWKIFFDKGTFEIRKMTI